jgi:hypothetical protein
MPVRLSHSGMVAGSRESFVAVCFIAQHIYAGSVATAGRNLSGFFPDPGGASCGVEKSGLRDCSNHDPGQMLVNKSFGWEEPAKYFPSSQTRAVSEIAKRGPL